jgi:hypothetical protein
MIDDWMQEGYAMEEDQRGDEACEIWWKVWRVLLPRFAPEMRTMQSADAVFLGTQSIFNWCQDFEMCLHNASLDEQRWATVGLQYCTEWLGQFTDESEVNQVSVRRAKAGFHFALGEAAEGEVVLRTILDRWPKNVWGYVGLADAYSHLFYKDGPPVDYPRAIGLLEQGLAAVDKGDRDREALQERLAEIRKRAGAPA